MDLEVPTQRHDRLLRRLFDQLPALIAYWDRDLRNVVANAAYVEWFGFTPEQVQGRHIREILGEDVFAKNRPYLEAALAGREQLFQRTLVDTLGRTRHTQASYVPDVVDDEVAGIFVLVTDVTPRVEAQADLDEAQEMAGVGSWTFRLADGAVTWSRQMYEITGQDPLTFEPSLEAYLPLIHPDDADRMRALQAEMAATAQDYEARYRLVVDGEVRHVHSRTRQVRDSDGVVVVMRGTIQDETRLQRQTDQLESANQLLGDMVGMIGHDVRQPVTVILGYLEQLLEVLDEGGGVGTVRAMAAAGYASAQRLSRLLDDLLVMANLDTGTLVAREQEVGLGAALGALVEELPDAGVTVVVDADSRVSVDPFHLRQAVTNLLANAQRYGAPPVEVRIGSRERDGETWATVTVSDHGEGVPEDFVPRLFDRFARASSGIATQVSGTGFGLHIVEVLVGLSGGWVSYAPHEPRGASFTLGLRRAPHS